MKKRKDTVPHSSRKWGSIKLALAKTGDIILIVIASISYILCFVLPDTTEVVCFISGWIAVAYCLYHIAIWIAKPIWRDWILVRGNFWTKVLCFVMYVPFAITLCFQEFKFSDITFSPKNLFFEKGIYKEDGYAQGDTLYWDRSVDFDTFRTYAENYGYSMAEDSIFTKDMNTLHDSLNEAKEDPHLFWSIYYHYVDPGSQHMASSASGRGWNALIAILGIFLLNGLLVSTLISWFDKQKDRWHNGEIRYKPRHFGKYRYAIVIGANEIAASVIRNLLTPKKCGEINFKCEGNNRYIILQTDQNVQDVRDTLASYLTEDMLEKVIIYKALRNSESEIKKLYPEYASEIYILGESTLTNGGEPYHDALNMTCVNIIAGILEKSRAKRLAIKEQKGISARRVCKVMFEYQTTYSIFQFSDIPATVKQNLVFIPFNRFESWAKKVIADGFSYADSSEKTLITYTPLDGTGIKQDSDKHVHFIIVGMSKMGIAMGIQAMLQSHYMNYERHRTRISFIDTEADKEMNFFKGRYSNLFELTRNRYIDANNSSSSRSEWKDPMTETGCKWKHLDKEGKNFIDIEIEFIKGSVESDGVRKYLKEATSAENALVTIAICLTKTHQAVAASLYMPIEVYKSKNLQEIWVYQRESADIIANLDTPSDLRYKKVRPFGMLHGGYMEDRAQYLKALLVNCAYDLGKMDKYTLSDKNNPDYKRARKSWRQLSVDKKWSNRFFANSISLKIRSVIPGDSRFCTSSAIIEQLKTNSASDKIIENAIKDNELLAKCEHNRWNVQQLILGYYPCDRGLFEEFVKLNSNSALGLDNGEFKRKKAEVKENELHMHPNICSYSCLDSVDSGAKVYDIQLNNAIPKILSLVDKHA